ncbi:MAG: acetyl/propionyl/methylcrotonyl-CoA carboxylase subunit alpha [Myxococcota bacterium]
MFHKVLIANRGEIAVRIIRACRELGLKTVAIYSEPDRHALHVAQADEAVCIGPAAASESYLNVPRLLEAARQTGADAVHPGFGFLSERAPFAQAVLDAGLVFIGPSPDTIERMGSKTGARALMEAAGVPVVPGYQGTDQSPERLMAEATRIGYPILVKAAAGGGGKGMRIVYQESELMGAIESARREAQKSFGDAFVFLERYIINPRHIEFQVFGDQQGHVVHLFERECSIQRRHQKVLEESPSVALSPALRQQMGDVAVMAAQAVHYVNAGTVEMILTPEGHYYFLEMNTRLQVEHPVTELVTGIDLVQLQLQVAQGNPLPFRQEDLRQKGHAIEVRVYAEDPANGFLPATGTVSRLREPTGPGIRVDSGLFPGAEVSVFYDPMLAKLIVWAEDRTRAAARMREALGDYVLQGVTTNLEFLRDVVCHPAYLEGKTYTSFIEHHLTPWQPRQARVPDEALIAAAVAELLEKEAGVSVASGEVRTGGDPYSPWTRLGAWRG